MKSLLTLALIAFSGMANATLGRTTECFDMAVDIPSVHGGAKDAYLKVEGMLCVREKNMKPVDQDEILSTGEITITITNGKGKTVGLYNLGARSSEGAMGTAHTWYAKDLKELEQGQKDQYADVIKFRMRNDHIKKSQPAGSVSIQNNRIILIQR